MKVCRGFINSLFLLKIRLVSLFPLGAPKGRKMASLSEDHHREEVFVFFYGVDHELKLMPTISLSQLNHTRLG